MYKNIHKILTGLSFFIPLIIYILTMAPTTSFWDCGEFISTSYILGVPHPPGAPFYLLLGNIFSSIPIFSDIGARVNLISPLVSALSVMFLYLIIVYLIEEYRGRVASIYDSIIICASAFIGAMTFAVTDAHWFNAVEAEVYSLSTFFTSIVVWMILKWSRDGDNQWNLRYLLMIVYMLGLAIGVHLLNLLTLPFVALIIYFKRFKFSVTSFLIPMIITLLTFVTIYIGIIKGIPDLMSKLSGNMGVVVIIPILLVLSILFFILAEKNLKFKIPSYITSAISFALLIILITNTVLIQSSNKISNQIHTDLIDIQEAIDQDDKDIYQLTNQIENSNLNSQQKVNDLINKRNNKVDDFQKLYKEYVLFEKNKDSLTFFDLLFWQSKFNIIIILTILLLMIGLLYKSYHSDYIKSSNIIKFIFTSTLLVLIGYSTYTIIFVRANQYPRINENTPDTIDRALSYMNRDQYGDWDILNLESTLQRPENTNWRRYTLDRENPSSVEKINFFVNYQINEMYLRYFAWQFIGRGDKENFPWYIEDLNGSLVGNQKLDGINVFRYGLPLAFILGMLGLFAHFKHDWRRALAVLSLFLATGLLIIIYLNQYDPQPRERDYSFVGSFFTFSIWIGIGLSSLQHRVKNFIENNNISLFILISVISLTFIFMPMKMLATDYFEHNRKDNYVAWDYGYNLLNSCEPNGIIFTNGDNDTFPLWYLQEVENLRKDVKVVNLSLLNTPWYIDQLMKQEPKLDFDFSNNSFKNDIYLLDPWYATEASFNLCSKTFSEGEWNNLECNLQVEDSILRFNIRPTLIGRLLRVQDYMILKIINDIGYKRPIYFAATVANNNQLGLEKYLVMEGMTYRLNFESNNSSSYTINYDKMKKNLTKSSLNKIIYTANNYSDYMNTDEGIYQYRNLDNPKIYFNDNIERLVQNYRIGFIRLAQYDIDRNKFKEAESLINEMNEYFPPDILSIEPGIALLISDSIYGQTNNNAKQLITLKNLFSQTLTIETEIYILHKLAELGDIEYVKDRATDLFVNRYNYLNFELEKYIGDILSDYLEADEFISYCNTIFEEQHIVGLLYSMVRVYDELGQRHLSIPIINDWLSEDPENSDLNQLYEYMVQINSIQ
jgi:hypothetical protein